MKSRSSRLLGCAVGLLSAAAVLFLAPGHRVVQGAKEGLAEAVIKGVEHREQLIRSIHSMRAVWHVDRLDTLGAGRPERIRERELFLLEGEKERTEHVFTRVGEGQGKEGAASRSRAADTSAGGGIRMIPLPSGTRRITVSDGRTAYTCMRPGMPWRRTAFEPGHIMPGLASWAGIEWRFASAQGRAVSPSWLMRQGTVTAERLPGPPERYKVTARNEVTRERQVHIWWVAPEYGYAVTRRQADYVGPPPVPLRRVVTKYEQFRELSPGVWLPHRYESRWYATRNGKLELAIHTFAVAEEMKLNIDIPDDNFRVPTSE